MNQDIGTPTQERHLQHPDIAPLDVLGMIRVLWHGKWIVLLAMMVMTLTAGYYAFRMASPQYTATATLQLDQVNEGTVVAASDAMSLNTVVAQVTSDDVLTRIITSMDLLNDPEFNRYLTPQSSFSIARLRTEVRHALAGTQEPIRNDAYILKKTIQNLRSTLSIVRQKDTYILHIAARSGDPGKAANLANTTAQQFLAHIDTTQEQARAEAELRLQARVASLRQQLDADETAVATLIATAQIQEGSVIDRLSAEVLAVEQLLSAARNESWVLETSVGKDSPRALAEIAQLQTSIRDLAGQKDRLSAQLSAQSAGLAQLHQIQLQADTTRQLYQDFLGRLQTNKLQASLQEPQMQRIAPAGDGQYVGPQKILILAIGAILGAALGVAFVAIMHCTRRGIIDAKGLRDATGLPVFAQLSRRILRPLRHGRRSLPLPPNAPLLQATLGLHTALTLATRDTSAQVILCTSSIKGEGGSGQAVALSHALASAGKSVALVSANTHSQVLRSTIDRDVFQQAIKNWPHGETKASDAKLGADILVIANSNESHGTLLTDQISDAFENLRQSYDHIIVDGPPVLLGPEARLFARHADAIVYSVRWSKTPQELVKRGLAALEDNGTPATGLVLSKINVRKMRKLSTDPCLGMIGMAHAI